MKNAKNGSLPMYTYPVETLRTGSSLGNPFAFARFDRETNLHGLWSSTDNRYYIGEWNVSFAFNGMKLEAVETIFSPESQATLFRGGGLTVRKTCFLPFSSIEDDDAQADDLRSVHFLIDIDSSPETVGELKVAHGILFPPAISDLFTKQPPPDEINEMFDVRDLKPLCEIRTVGAENEVRIFGSSTDWKTFHHTDRTLLAEYSVSLERGATRELSYSICVSPDGAEAAHNCYRRTADVRSLRLAAVNNYRRALSSSTVATPDPMINRGVQWAKVNSLRVQHRFRTGDAFTNDPPQDIVVIRDLAWYVLGSDYLTPRFSRSMLEFAERFAYHEGGKLTEYLHADEELPVQHDYKLNINDDTPLFVYALYHHAITSADDFAFGKIYPLMKRACDWILSQMKGGLVHCDAEGTNVWGICGWRNIIDDYTLNGAVTEINAECYQALLVTGAVAKILHNEDDARRYTDAANELKTTINRELVSDKTGMYLLNVEKGGAPRHDVTGDLIFPVFFGVADEVMKKNILAKLTDKEMWTVYGSRTVSKNEANYDPDFGYQLVGGLWHNLTAWIAYCGRAERPDLVIEGMRNAFRLCEIARPVDFDNVVPGQFPERLHGESYASRGMTMSPWMPPTYLWLAVEGLLGIEPTTDGLGMNPNISGDWKWIAIRHLPYKGKYLDAFLHGGILYATLDVRTRLPLNVGTPCATQSDNDELFTIGMLVGEEYLLFAASDSEAAGSVTLHAPGVRQEAIIEQCVVLQSGTSVLMRFPAQSYADRTKAEALP